MQNPSWAIIIMLDDKQIRADVIGKKGSTHKSNNKCIKKTSSLVLKLNS